MARETLDEVRARIAKAEADKQAEFDKKLAEFDRQTAKRKAKADAEQQAE